jgi:hypothetical protein
MTHNLNTNECFASEDGFHAIIDTPPFADEDNFEVSGLICKYCGEEFE